jgi:hypothetical protein
VNILHLREIIANRADKIPRSLLQGALTLSRLVSSPFPLIKKNMKELDREEI